MPAAVSGVDIPRVAVTFCIALGFADVIPLWRQVFLSNQGCPNLQRQKLQWDDRTMLDPLTALTVTLKVAGALTAALNIVWDGIPDTTPATGLAETAKKLFSKQPEHNEAAVWIAIELQKQLPSLRDTPAAHNTADQVISLITHLARDRDAMLVAVQDPDQFNLYVTQHHGTRPAIDESQQSLYNDLRRVALAKFLELAPTSLTATSVQVQDTNQRIITLQHDIAEYHDQIHALLTENRALLQDTPRRTADEVLDLFNAPGNVGDLIRQVHGATVPGTNPHPYATAATRASAAGAAPAGPSWSTLDRFDPFTAGVHHAITTPDTTTAAGGVETLTSYIPRPHDHDVADAVNTVANQQTSRMIVVHGNSCAGKTRAAYRAITTHEGLTDWPVYAPTSQRELAHQLTTGLPGPCIIWLDELHRTGYLDPTRPEATTTTEGLLELLTTPPHDGVGPYLIITTLWTDDLHALTNPPHTPDPAGTATLDNTRQLLTSPNTHQILVADTFTDADPHDIHTAAARDPRIHIAVTTSGDPSRITQTLAGGPRLLDRLYPTPTTPNPYTPEQRAILLAAGDLYRIGHTTPIPTPLLEHAATDYLDDPVLATPDWTTHALAAVSHAAINDHHHTHDHATHGIPALTTNPTTTPPTHTLHDYLTQDHLTRHHTTPTQPSLWTATTTHQHLLPPDTHQRITHNASNRGLYTTVRTLTQNQLQQLTTTATTNNPFAHQELADLLAIRADIEGLTNLANSGDTHSQLRLAGLLADRGDLTQLTNRANNGDRHAQFRLADLLARRGDQNELTKRANNHDGAAQYRLTELLAARDDIQQLTTRADNGDQCAQRRLAELLAHRGDTGLQELTTRADKGDNGAKQRLFELRATRGDIVELLTAAADSHDGEEAKWRLIELLAARGDTDQLTTRANNGDEHAQQRLARLLADRSDTDQLTERANNGDKHAQQQLAELLASRAQGLELLRTLVLGGDHEGAASRLIGLLLTLDGRTSSEPAELTTNVTLA